MHAIVITMLGDARDIELPDDDRHRAEIRRIVGGSPDQGLYHHEALLWVHGDGANGGLRRNLVAWALACTWRSLTLPHQFYGDVVVTGRAPDGTTAPLATNLAEQVRTITTTTLETVWLWQRRPPASNEAALSDLLAYAARDIGR
ncbi:hypothetical protein [Streptacidiphilus neutrinimicus]|uniref:hypothetical protein n=1 Tax=Streptacidiphilus neutrinimicus TaxID=105420 RepID=UPI0005AAE52B|nr:hypothetical protein [Streptacidiphilus neutrinimicus]